MSDNPIIKKSKPFPLPPQGYVPSRPSRQPAPASNNSNPLQSGNTIKEMQKAILNFANVVSATDVTNLKGNQEGQMEGPRSHETPNPKFDPNKPESASNPKTVKNKEYLGGSDPFGNFLVDQYLNESNPVGHQYVNTDVSGQKNREGIGAGQNINLRGIIDSIKRIGSPGTQGTEKEVDGIWAARTNNALKNIFALTYAMFNLSSDMGLELPGLNQETLNSFKQLVPEDYSKISGNAKAAAASKLSEIINNMSKVFGSFKNFVLTNNKYKSYIDQKSAFEQYEKVNKTKNPLDQNDQQILEANKFDAIPGVVLSNVQDKAKNYVTLKDLEDMDSFKIMVQRMGFDANNPQQVQKIYQEIMGTLSNKPSVDNPGY